MPAEFFVDTSAWYPLLVATHPDHDTLADALRGLIARRHRLVTTNLVVAETHALLLRRASRAGALAFARTVGEPPNLVVRSSRELEERATRDWLARYADQDFSFADAVSFALMAERRITEALTLDHHFTVAGFRAVDGAR
ncbi:MAG: PIN domain-containing protein [Gemmatimonadaceae bacterium]